MRVSGRYGMLWASASPPMVDGVCEASSSEVFVPAPVVFSCGSWFSLLVFCSVFFSIVLTF